MEAITRNTGFVITIGARIFIGFMALGLPILFSILLLMPKVESVVELSQEIQKFNVPQTIDTAISKSADYIYYWIESGDPQDKINIENIWLEINDLSERTDKLLKLPGNESMLPYWLKLQTMLKPYQQIQMEILNTPRDKIDIQMAWPKIAPIKRDMLLLLSGTYSPEKKIRENGIYPYLIEQIQINTALINAHLDSLKNYAFWFLILTVLLTIIVPLMTLRSITGLINGAIHVAERIAKGERDVDINLESAAKLGKLGQLLFSLKTLQDAVKKNEETLRTKEEEARELLEKLVNSSKKIRQFSSKVAAGDLREHLQLDDGDILKDLGKDLNLMTDGLASITQKISKVSTDIVGMVKTVLNSANKQTEGITSQASAINEISASLEEIDKSSKQTMTKAQALREIAKSTYEQGKLGSESVEQSIDGIKASEEKMKLIAQTIVDLSNHTQQIGDITDVVNTLSQQSKMLALNASIEASKAGEAGKGFAAVATEVRNLAEQSEQSTIQVQKILEDIRRSTEKAVTVTEEGVATLESGTKLIEKAGEVINTLSTMINEASISSQHIEVAIRQESVGLEQIVEGMNEINRITATFSTSIKEMMTFIENLDDIAKHLQEDVDIYKV